MQILLEQIFYGRGERGYAILGNSPGAANFTARVDYLCGAVGTPNNDYRGEPFLLSVPEKDSVIMICGRRGTPDSMGRETLFFHAIVAEKSALINAKVDAVSLFYKGAFADKMPSVDIAPLCVDVKPLENIKPQPGSVVDWTMPCVIRSEKPVLDVVRTVVGDRALELSWATFAFQSMQDFDVQVLPLRAPCLRTVDEYDTMGKHLRFGSVESEPKADKPPRRYSSEWTQPSGRQVVSETAQNQSSAMFKLSVAINIVLVAFCAVLLVSRKSVTNDSLRSATPIVVTNTVEKIVKMRSPAQLSDSQRTEIEDAAIQRYRSEQMSKFPNESRLAFLNFHSTATNLFNKYYGPDYDSDTEENQAGLRKEHRFFSDLEIGITFVNENLLKRNTP